MNTGRSLQDLAAELERQTATRKDYIAPQGKLEAVVIPEVRNTEGAIVNRAEVAIEGFNAHPMGLTSYAHGQLAAHLDIPKKYYDRMHAETPVLLADNVNTWLGRDADNARMLRTLDGKIRGVLSPKYRPLDNFDLAQTVLPVLIENEAQIVSSELTETRIYIKAILPRLSDELPAGLAWGTGHNAVGAGVDRGRVVSAIVISNSEVGNGALRVEPSVFTSWCTNLAIMAQAAMKKYHVGRANDILESSFEVFTSETRKADDRAFWMKVRDVMAVSFDEKLFRAAIEDMKRAGQRPIKSEDLNAVVTRTVTELALPQATSTGVLKFLAAGGDLTQWGLSSAITRVAGEAADYEMATALERAGGQVLALPARTWDAIATAA